MLKLLVDLDQSPVEEVSNMTARRPARVTYFEDLGGLREGEPCCAGPVDELEPLHRLVAVVAVPGRGTLRRLEQPALLVIPQRGRPRLRLPREFSDPHRHLRHRLDLQAYFKVHSFRSGRMSGRFELEEAS